MEGNKVLIGVLSIIGLIIAMVLVGNSRIVQTRYLEARAAYLQARAEHTEAKAAETRAQGEAEVFRSAAFAVEMQSLIIAFWGMVVPAIVALTPVVFVGGLIILILSALGIAGYLLAQDRGGWNKYEAEIEIAD